ncbi:MAG: BBE domain-containing protein [Gammaproteobacteria bacterium]|nr:BBE domain-containing protein [Gammaproteobacteria bacterium]
MHAACGTETYERLAAIKEKPGPDNFFRVNLNLRPLKERRPAEAEAVR